MSASSLSAKNIDVLHHEESHTTGVLFKTPVRKDSDPLPLLKGLSKKVLNYARFSSAKKSCAVEMSGVSKSLSKQVKVDRSGSAFLRSKDDSETRAILCPQKRQSQVAMSTYSKTSITKKRLGDYKPLQALGAGKFARVRLYQHVTSR